MAQQRVTCAACGNQEAAGVRFCGRCGAPMDGSGGPLGRTPRASNQMATGARPPGGGFTQNPTAIAAVLGVVAVVIVVAALVLSGGDKKKDDPNARRPGGGGAGGDFPTQTVPGATATPGLQVIPTPTPQPTPLPQPTPVPQATPLPEPTATPVPPPPEPTATPVPPPPQPTATPLPPPPPPPQVPAAKVTNPFLVGLTITGGHGSSHRIGTSLQLCYTAVAGVWVRVYDTRTPSVLLFPEGVDDGTGGCINGVVDPPTGVDTIRIDAYTYIQQPNGTRTRGNFRDFASISIIATP